jgi:acyl-coenzyme A synthetase/AMP-(fatty) acid ligase
MALEWCPDAFARLLGAWLAECDVALGGSVEVNKDALDPFRKAGPLLVMQSGGTSGRARHPVHDLTTFLSRYPFAKRPVRQQLFLYSAGHLAGLDAFLQAFVRGSTLMLTNGSQDALQRIIKEERLDVLAATPSQLQFHLLSGTFEGNRIAHPGLIVYGAEPMPDALLERLQAALPQTLFEQRFGMTELGTLPVRADPDDPGALFIDEPFRWKVVDGELHIDSPGRMLGTLEEGPTGSGAWYSTGDAAEMTPSGAVRVFGRLQSQINVGGLKILPERVEAALLSHDDIADVSVHGESDTLTGERVVAEVVLAPFGTLSSVRSQVRRHCLKAGLPLAAVPSKVRAVEHIERTAIGKRSRSALRNA